MRLARRGLILVSWNVAGRRATFPGATPARLDALIDRHVDDAATKEWPAMADQRAAQSRPFSGEFGIEPEALLEVAPSHSTAPPG